MKVLVTGAAGFIGSWTMAGLAKEGFQVVGADKMASQETITFDITNLNEVSNLFERVRPDAVVHLAAISGSTGKNEIEQSMRQAYDNFNVNALGTASICEACRKNKVKRLVYMSSFAVYGRTGPDRLPITPETPVSLEHAYATSKYMGELVVKNYSEDFGIRSAVFRTPFIVGEGQRERNVVQEMIECAVEGRELVVFGEGAHVREFIHPSDLVDGYARAIPKIDEFTNACEVFVLGNKPVKIRDLAEDVVRIVGRGTVSYKDDTRRVFDQYCDYSKASNVLGWFPKMKVREIIERIVDADFSVGRS